MENERKYNKRNETDRELVKRMLRDVNQYDYTKTDDNTFSTVIGTEVTFVVERKNIGKKHPAVCTLMLPDGTTLELAAPVAASKLWDALQDNHIRSVVDKALNS